MNHGSSQLHLKLEFYKIFNINPLLCFRTRQIVNPVVLHNFHILHLQASLVFITPELLLLKAVNFKVIFKIRINTRNFIQLFLLLFLYHPIS